MNFRYSVYNKVSRAYNACGTAEYNGKRYARKMMNELGSTSALLVIEKNIDKYDYRYFQLGLSLGWNPFKIIFVHEKESFTISI